MTAPDRIAVYWTAVDEDTMPARLMAQTPRSPIFDEDLPKSQRIEYVRADLATPQSWDDVTGTKHVQFPRTTPLAEALAVVLDALKDGEVWGRAVNGASAVLNSGMPEEYWTRPKEIRESLDAALRAIGEGRA